MNIMIIDHYAGSPFLGMEFRPYYLGKEWVKMGHKVTIIGASFSHLRKVQPILGEETIDGIKYIWIKTNRYSGNGIGRLISMLIFVAKLYFSAKKLAKKINPDVVIASSTYPLDIYPARKISRFVRGKISELIYEVHDLWPMTPMVINGYSKWHPFILIMQLAENYSYRYSYKVISLLWNACDYMVEHGMNPDKFVYIPNGYYKEEWYNAKESILPKEHSKLFSTLKNENKFIIGYAGGHTLSTAMEVFIDVAKLLINEKNLAFVLVGEGISKKKLIERAISLKLNNVYFLSGVNKLQIPMIIQHFDIAYMGGIHSILHKYGTSFNKMTDYMLSAKPIIFAADEPDSLIERVECGVRVEAENPRQVADAVMRLSSMSPEELTIIGDRGKEYAISQLEYSILSKRYIDVLTIKK